MPASTDKRRSRRGEGGGEFALLARVRAAVERLGRGRGVLVGIGDDCAVVEGPRRGARLVLTTDTMVESVHFDASWLTPRELGVRAFRASVSDVAAMGARPRYVLLSLELPAERFVEAHALALVRGVAADAKRTGATLVGGNVSGGPRLAVTVTVVGETAGPALLRSAAKPGDLVFVTGRLGGAAAGWRALAAGDRGAAKKAATSAAWRRPPLRLDFAAALSKARVVHAMIDVSDGLLQDLGHVAEESKVTIRVDATAVPVHRAATLPLALGGGEDYELAFTAPPSKRSRVEALAAAARVPLAVIGVVAKGRPVVTGADGRPFENVEAGFDHLKSRHPSRSRRR